MNEHLAITVTPATADDLALLDSHFASAKIASKSITLRQHDSINLTTGEVTRSDRSRFASATSSNRPDVLRHRYGTAKITYAVEIGLRANDPDAFRVAITLAACEWCGEMDHSGDDCPC
jgi:hypothetical protein